MTLLDLSADEVLNTTRAVRKRLDFSRPVEDDVIRECVATAMQAPSGSNLMTMQFVVVKDAEKRQAIGEVYKQCWAIYSSTPMFAGAIEKEGDVRAGPAGPRRRLGRRTSPSTWRTPRPSSSGAPPAASTARRR